MRGDRLRKRREELGLSQADLGERLGIEGRAVFRYEKGQNDPSAEMLGRMATELEVTADWLLGLVDEPNARLTEEALSPIERKLIAAVRKGLILEAMETTIQLSKRDDQSNVSGTQPAPNS